MTTRRQPANTETDRAVSPILAVALLILIALGLTAGLQTVGSGLIDGIEQPPSADITVEPGQNDLQMMVMRTTNTDRLNIVIDGEEITDADGDPVIAPSAGSSTTLDWSGSASGGHVDVSSEVTPGESVITVVAADFPENSVTVFSYDVPEL